MVFPFRNRARRVPIRRTLHPSRGTNLRLLQASKSQAVTERDGDPPFTLPSNGPPPITFIPNHELDYCVRGMSPKHLFAALHRDQKCHCFPSFSIQKRGNLRPSCLVSSLRAPFRIFGPISSSLEISSVRCPEPPLLSSNMPRVEQADSSPVGLDL